MYLFIDYCLLFIDWISFVSDFRCKVKDYLPPHQMFFASLHEIWGLMYEMGFMGLMGLVGLMGF